MEHKLQNIYLIIYNLFIDNTEFLAKLLLNLTNNLSVGSHRIKCKYRQDDKKV